VRVLESITDLELARGVTVAPISLDVQAVVVEGVTRTAANIYHGWIGYDVADHLDRALCRPIAVMDDADAAGLAEVSQEAHSVGAGSVPVIGAESPKSAPPASISPSIWRAAG